MAEQVRRQMRALGLTPGSAGIAVTEGGKGLEEALQRQRADNVTTILDGYPAAEPLCDGAKVGHGSDEPARQQGREQAQGLRDDLNGWGMRWVEDGAATGAALRALYVSGGNGGDGFWAQPHRTAA